MHPDRVIYLIDRANQDYSNIPRRRRRKGKNMLSRLCEVQRGRCAYCYAPTTKPTIDHVIPFRKGGTDDYENLVMCCAGCNTLKGTIDADIFWYVLHYDSKIIELNQYLLRYHPEVRSKMSKITARRLRNQKLARKNLIKL